jgi:serine protease Do
MNNKTDIRAKLVERLFPSYRSFSWARKTLSMSLQQIVCLGVIIFFCLFRTVILAAQEHTTPKIRVVPDYLSGEEAQAVQLYHKVLSTVVTIFASQRVLTPEGPQQKMVIGSGVLVSPESHILTAAHVVRSASNIIVKTICGKLRPAELLFSDSRADIAVIELLTPAPALQHAELGDSDLLAVGQIVYAIGSPYGLEHSFSVGHISGFRDFNRLYNGTIQAEFIQTDAAMNLGNSGGPLFNSQGQVVGITSRILTMSGGFEGLGFAVAINTVKQLLTLEDRGCIGIEGIFLSRDMITRLLNHDLEGGVLVERVFKGSPADRAGLRGGSVSARILGQDVLFGGDLIIEIGPQTCQGACLEEAHKHLTGLDRIPVKFLRDGKIMETVIEVSTTRWSFLKKREISSRLRYVDNHNTLSEPK